MTNMLRRHERLVIETFLKRVVAIQTLIEDIDPVGVRNVTLKPTPVEHFDEVLDSLFEAHEEFRAAKRSLSRLVRTVEFALKIDADRKNAEADRRSQEASFAEMIARWTVEAEQDSVDQAYARNAALVDAYLRSHGIDPARGGFAVRGLVPQH